MTMNVRERDFKVLYAMLGAKALKSPQVSAFAPPTSPSGKGEIKGLWGTGKPVAGGKGDQKDQAGVGLHPTTDQGE